MYEFIYLLQTRESIGKNEEVYKVGRTCKDELTRFNNYPKGSKLHLHISCINSCNIERSIINIFGKVFTNVELYGKEYFEGNLFEMLTIILEQVALSFNCLSSSIEYCKILRKLESQNLALTKQIETEKQNNETMKLQILKLQQKNSNLTQQENSKLKQENSELKQENSKLKQECNNSTQQENQIQLVDDEVKGKLYTCSKCQKQFNRRDRFRSHESKCDGLDSKQCKICLKMFTTYQGKYQHNKNVKCSPPPNPII